MKCHRFVMVILTAVCIATLTGCIAAVPLIFYGPMAASGFALFKAGQTQMKGVADVKFDMPEIEDKEALASIKTLAIFPDPPPDKTSLMLSSVMLAQDLSSTNILTVVTPMTVSVILTSNALPLTIEDMTDKERLDAFRLVADKSGADAIFVASGVDMKFNNKFFTFSRSTITYGAELFIYSRTKDEIIWKDAAALVVKQGSSMPGSKEMQSFFSGELTEKLWQMTAAPTD